MRFERNNIISVCEWTGHLNSDILQIKSCMHVVLLTLEFDAGAEGEILNLTSITWS